MPDTMEKTGSAIFFLNGHAESTNERERNEREPTVTTPVENVRCGSQSVTGKRESNEDRCFVDARQGVFVVADGMGGHHGGAEASRIVVETVPPQLAAALERSEVSLREMQYTADRAIESARNQMVHYAACRFGFEKMGATVVVGAFVEDRMYFCHLGDSRAYHYRRGRIKQLTQDHTYVQALVQSRTITAEQAKTHPMRNVVLSSVSVGDLDSRPEVSVVNAKPGDRFLFCSDGLTGVVDQKRLEKTLHSIDDPQQAAEELVRLALELQSKDNVTCVVVDILHTR